MSSDALTGKRIGLYGPGWRNLPLSEEAISLYDRAKIEMKAQGAELVDDPFAGSGFADLRQPTPPLVEFDARGLESLPYDLEQYLKRMGPDVALKTFAEFAAATATEDAFGPGGVLSFMHSLPQFGPCLANPSRPPDLSEFVTLKETYLEIFDAVFSRERLDAVVFPQMREELAPLHSGDSIHETTVGEINIAGLPGVVVPAGYYTSGAPFCLIFVGRQWSEADLLAYAYAYEGATKHRRAPVLKQR